jgi:hypothetical protein
MPLATAGGIFVMKENHLSPIPRSTLACISGFMSVAYKSRKCPNCLGMGRCHDGSLCPTCEGRGEVPYSADIELPDEPCWSPT